MATLFRKLETDLTTVRLDLNAGTSTTFTLFGDLDLGESKAENVYVSDPASPETRLASTKRDLVPVKFRLKAQQTTTDNLRTLAQSLATELDRPGPWLVQLNSQASPLYFDVPGKADIGHLVRGQEMGAYKIAQLLTDVDGLPVTLYRMPYFYAASVTSSTFTVNNDPSTGTNPKRISLTVSGNMPTPLNVKVAPEAGAKIVQVRLGRRAWGDATTFNAQHYQRLAAATLTSSATVTDTSNATSNTAVNLTSASPSTSLKRTRTTVNPATPSGIEGTFRVYGRFRPSTTNAQTHKVTLKWSGGNADPATFANEEVTLDYPGVTSQTEYRMVDLGTVTVSTALGTTYGLALEVWNYREAGTAGDDLYGDYLQLFPTAGGVGDQMQTISARGFRDGLGSGAESWIGSQLITPSGFSAGSDEGSVRVLNFGTSTFEACASPPAAGMSLASGRHSLSADIRLVRAQGTTTAAVGYVAAYNVTAATSIAFKALKFGGAHQTVKDYRVTLTFDHASADLVRLQVYTGSPVPADTGTIRVKRILHTFSPSFGTGFELNSNGDYALASGRPAAYLTASGTYNQPLTSEGAFLVAAPGANTLVFDWGDLPAASTEDIDVREPLARSVLSRSCDVTVTYRPRFSG